MRGRSLCRGRERKVRAGVRLARRLLILATVIVLAVQVGATGPAKAQSRTPNPYFCNRVKNHKIFGSQGVQMYCFGPQPTTGNARRQPRAGAPVLTPANVAASNLAEDVAPNGTRG